MADSKITALAALTTADPANDMFPVVDVSDTSMAASGTTKRISINNILACSPSATLASATITGDLTVDTSTLKVDSVNNRVIVGHTSGSSAFQVTNAGAAGLEIQPTGFSSAPLILSYNRSGSAYTQLTLDGSTIVHALNGSTAMTLNANGLGIGVTPSAWSSSFKALQIGNQALWSVAGGNGYLSNNTTFNTSNAYVYRNNGFATEYIQSAINGVHAWFIAPSGTAGNAITFTQAMTLDASGNLLVGQTSASGTTVGCYLSAGGQFNAATANQDNLNIYNTTAAAYRFYVNSFGTVFATNTTISAISDARLKENVQDLDVGLNEVLALKPRKFDWKAGKGKDIKGDRGFIAQEFETVFPNLIDEWKDNAPEGEAPYKSVRADLIPVLVKAIQELTARVQTLEAK